MNCILLTAGGGGGSGAYSPPDDTTVLDMSAEQWSDLFTLFVKDLTGSTDSAAEDAEFVDSDDEEAVAAAAAAKKAAAAAALEKQAAAAPQCYLLLSDAPAGKAKAWKAFAANYAELWRRIGDAASGMYCICITSCVYSQHLQYSACFYALHHVAVDVIRSTMHSNHDRC
jgi:hypothetical protein